METGATPSTAALAKPEPSLSSVTLLRASLRRRPVRTAFGLLVEYATFASAVFLALSLYLTRVPMRLVDRALGLCLRERFVNLLARVSPG